MKLSETNPEVLRDLYTHPREEKHGWAVGAFVAFVVLVAVFAPTPASAQEHTARAAIAEAFPAWAVASFVRIANCESEFVPTAVAEGWDRRYGYYRYVGLLQIDPALHQWRADRLFWKGASLYDPRVNAHVAAEIFAAQGWGAWPYCRRFA